MHFLYVRNHGWIRGVAWGHWRKGDDVEKRQSIPIGPLWYSEATMPAIGRRSTKPLNDPPRRTAVLQPLYFNLGNPPYTPSNLSTHASIPDSKLPHFSVLMAGRCIDDRTRMIMQSRVISDVSYALIDDLSSPDILMEFLWVTIDVATRLLTNSFILNLH